MAAQARIEADPRLELVTPASLGILTFRRRGADDETAAVTDRRNEAIVRSLAAGGEVLVTSTLVKGRYAIRLCVLNHTTEDEDVAFAIDRVAEAEASDLDLATAAPERLPVAGTTVKTVALAPARVRRRGAASSPQLRGDHRRPGRSLPGRRPRGALHRGHGGHGALGAARTFYIVLDGEVAVTIDAIEVNRLVGGNSFGEVAATDWGRDSATAERRRSRATTPTRLLAVPGAALRELMLDSPAVDAAIRQIAYDRMHRAIGAT